MVIYAIGILAENLKRTKSNLIMMDF